jgi:O-antigen biosynthesis protein WbqV
MGPQIHILELARALIRRAGLKPDQDILIEFTAPSPGEKLREELSSQGESPAPSEHAKIRTFVNAPVDRAWLEAYMDELRACMAARDLGRLMATISKVVPEYRPSVALEPYSGSLNATT